MGGGSFSNAKVAGTARTVMKTAASLFLPPYCKTLAIPSLLANTAGTTEYTHTEWQRQLTGVHSIMMEKLAQAGESGGR
jgi:hypothetical protein